MPPVPQTKIGSYRLLNLVRSGKTAQIWEVMNDAKNQRFALKLLSDEHRNNAEEVGMIKHEYAVGHKLDHPNVVHIYDLGHDPRFFFMAMEYYPAPNLKQFIQQSHEKLIPMAAQIIEQAAASLGYLHSRGWVHRDVKPDNFLINKTGEVKLIDFALGVKIKGFLGRLLGGKSKVMGTRSYMSPEQIRGLTVDGRSDLYSFGCVIHELLGGKPPFTGANTNELLNKHLHSPPPPLEAANHNVSKEICALVKRMLAKDPKARPQSMDAVLQELRGMKLFKSATAAARS